MQSKFLLQALIGYVSYFYFFKKIFKTLEKFCKRL